VEEEWATLRREQIEHRGEMNFSPRATLQPGMTILTALVNLMFKLKGIKPSPIEARRNHLIHQL
jgi:hypothetical protein